MLGKTSKFSFTCAISIKKVIVPKLLELQGFTPARQGRQCTPEKTERREASCNEQSRISMSLVWDLKCRSQTGICVTLSEAKVKTLFS